MASEERELADPQTTDLINTILNDIRQEHGLTSDEALRQHLNVSDLTIYRWRKGEMGKSARRLIPLIVQHLQAQTAA